jgi:Kef-type K+ transport system membrane component KefB
MNSIGFILLQLFIIFTAAKVMADLSRRLKQPEVIGELLAGAILGSYALGVIGEPNDYLIGVFEDKSTATEALNLVLETFSELGVIVLLFSVGLETRLTDMLNVGRRAATAGVLGVVIPFALGYGFMNLSGEPTVDSLFLATAMVATSVGITARVLQEMGVLQSTEARIILGAAVLDDILALVLLATVTGIAGTGTINPGSIIIIIVQAFLFITFVILAGKHIISRYQTNLSKLHIPDAPLVVALGTMMGLAGLASYFRLAAIIGAFLAGVLFAELPERSALEERVRPIYHFLVPFFFVLTGAKVDWGLLITGGSLGFAIAVTLLAIVGKAIAGSISGWGMKRRSVMVLSVGMVPRGEVGLIVAGLGLSMNAIDLNLFSVVVFMSIATTVVVPPVLKLLYAKQSTAMGVRNGTSNTTT